MQISRLVDTWEAVRSTRSRLAKTAAVTELLCIVDPGDASIVVSYLSGELPQGRIGLGWAAIGAVKPEVADASTLSVSEVDTCFESIKDTSGKGSKAAKAALLDSLLSQATSSEQEFIKRLLLGELRQGALEGIMADAVAEAADIPAPLVRRAAMLSGDLAAIAAEALDGGAEALQGYSLKVFTAVQPMLAQSAETVTKALERTGPASIEWKLDGARVQVHRHGDKIKVFTRNLRDITASSPDVVQAVANLDVQSIILDGEAIALRSDASPIPFQDTMSRFSSEGDGRLSVLFFDCLHLNGRDLIDLAAHDRWHAMAQALPAEMLIPRIETSDATEGESFFADALAAGHEGAMVKALDALYEAGRRGAGWIKVKPVHTLDLVVIGIEWGSGRRSGWLSNLHLGARDPERPDNFVMVGKTFKGMTDDMLRWQTERFLELETHRDGHVVFVRPEQVVEIAIDGVQRSTRYPGGVALRFARVKGYREDKTADQADTISAVQAFHVT